MKINYNPELDVLCFRLSDGVQERDEVEPGMIVSYDPNDYLVSIEILAASTLQPAQVAKKLLAVTPEKFR
jgi:uncharacterized protein YuzE